MSFNVSRYEEPGLGRLENRWFSFERKVLFNHHYFSNGVKYLFCQWDTNLLICVILCEKFNSIISDRLREKIVFELLHLQHFV